MIKQRKAAWPNPADTALDRARAVARDLHQRLAKHDPDEAARVARAAATLGEPWLEPALVIHGDDDWLTLQEAAEAINGTPDMIYKWTRRGDDPLRTRTDDRSRVLVRFGDVRDYQAEQRRRRAGRRS